VELCIDQLQGVSESAVIGVPDADFGERVTAVVVAEADEPGEEAIIAALRPLLAAYKLPKQVTFVDALPRNAMGKVQKNILRERFAK
jgi:malonyl-CoA/methylmalonyl-CoA synthetase